MADVIRFARSVPVQPAGNSNWRRFPRFDEVGQQIDVQANKLLDVAGSQARYTELYSKVEQRLRSDARCSATCSRPLRGTTSVSSMRPTWLDCRPATALSQGCHPCSTTTGPTTTGLSGPEGSALDRPALVEQILPHAFRPGDGLGPLPEVLASVELIVHEKDQRAFR